MGLFERATCGVMTSGLHIQADGSRVVISCGSSRLLNMAQADSDGAKDVRCPETTTSGEAAKWTVVPSLKVLSQGLRGLPGGNLTANLV